MRNFHQLCLNDNYGLYVEIFFSSHFNILIRYFVAQFHKMLVMGQGPSLARAWLGALGFWRALGPTLGEGLKPRTGPGPWSKAQGLKGLLKYDFPLKKLALLWKILSKNLKS